MLHVHVLHQDINLTNVCTCWTSCCQQGFYFKSLCLFTAVQTDCVMVTVSKGSTHTSSVVSMWEEGIRTKDYGKCMQGFIHHRVCWWGVLSLFSFIFHYASILILLKVSKLQGFETISLEWDSCRCWIYRPMRHDRKSMQWRVKNTSISWVWAAVRYFLHIPLWAYLFHASSCGTIIDMSEIFS